MTLASTDTEPPAKNNTEFYFYNPPCLSDGWTKIHTTTKNNIIFSGLSLVLKKSEENRFD